jgi:hypothetical protein
VRKLVGFSAAALLAVAAYGCGASGSSVSVGVRPRLSSAAQPAGQSASAVRTVEYLGVEFDVPAGWPVYDLAKDPTTCVRSDRHAVYLGNPSPDMQCPAGLIGHTELVIVQPADAPDHAMRHAKGDTPRQINDLAALVDNGTSHTHRFSVTFPTENLDVTINTSNTVGVAESILQSFRRVHP